MSKVRSYAWLLAYVLIRSIGYPPMIVGAMICALSDWCHDRSLRAFNWLR